MRYVCAQRELKLDSGRIAKFGEPVPEADDWPEGIRRANIRMGHIRVEGEPCMEDRWGPRAVPVATVIGMDDRKIPQWLRQQAAVGNANAKFEARMADDAKPVAPAPAEAPDPEVVEGTVAEVLADSATTFDDLLGDETETPRKRKYKKRGRPPGKKRRA
jgi:hypothetical protein